MLQGQGGAFYGVQEQQKVRETPREILKKFKQMSSSFMALFCDEMPMMPQMRQIRGTGRNDSYFSA
ncbi:MAG TPA: hypothetical protein VGA55_08065, partial [Bacteroidota bacterium]